MLICNRVNINLKPDSEKSVLGLPHCTNNAVCIVFSTASSGALVVGALVAGAVSDKYTSSSSMILEGEVKV